MSRFYLIFCFLAIAFVMVFLAGGLAQAQTTCSADQVMCYPCSGGTGWCQASPCPTCGTYTPPPETTPPPVTTPPPATSPESCAGGQVMCYPCGGGGTGWCQASPCPTCGTYTPPPATSPGECGGGMVRCYGTNDNYGWCQNPPCPVACPSGQWKCYTSTSDTTGYCSSTSCPPMTTTGPTTCATGQVMCAPCGGGASYCQTPPCPTCGAYITPTPCPSNQWRCYASFSDTVGYCSSTACPTMTSTQITCPSGQNACYPCAGGVGWCQTGSCPTCGAYTAPAACLSGQWRCYSTTADTVGYCSSVACPAVTATPTTPTTPTPSTTCNYYQPTTVNQANCEAAVTAYVTCNPLILQLGQSKQSMIDGCLKKEPTVAPAPAPTPTPAPSESPATCLAGGGKWCYGTNGSPGWCQGGGGVCPSAAPALQPTPTYPPVMDQATCASQGNFWCLPASGQGTGWCQTTPSCPTEVRPAEFEKPMPKMPEQDLKREKKNIERDLKNFERDLKRMLRKDKTALDGFLAKITALREKLNGLTIETGVDGLQDVRDEIEDLRFAAQELQESLAPTPVKGITGEEVGPAVPVKEEMDEKMAKQALRQLQREVKNFKGQFTRLQSRLKSLEKKKIVIPASIMEVATRGKELIVVISKATDLAAAESAMEELRNIMESMNEITPRVELLSRLPEVTRMMNQEIRRLEADVKKVKTKVKKLEKQGFSAATDWLAELQNGLAELKEARNSVTGGSLNWEEDVMSYIGETFFDKLTDVRQNLEKVVALSNLQQFIAQVDKEVAKAVKLNKKAKNEEAADLINQIKEKLASVKQMMKGKITEEEIDPIIMETEEVFELRNELTGLLNLGVVSKFEKMMKTLQTRPPTLMFNLPAVERLMVRTYQTKNFFASFPQSVARAE